MDVLWGTRGRFILVQIIVLLPDGLTIGTIIKLNILSSVDLANSKSNSLIFKSVVQEQFK